MPTDSIGYVDITKSYKVNNTSFLQ